MLTLDNQVLDITETETLSSKFSKYLELGDVVMLSGDLGTGKTTISRFIINNLFSLNNLVKPASIKSPTYPILITYNLNEYDIYHYDLYRIKNIVELEELDFFENIQNAITLIEWPEILINLPFVQKYYYVNLELYSENKRVVTIKYFDKNL